MRQNRGLYIAGAVFLVAAAIYFFADKNVKAPAVAPSPLPSPVVRLGASQVQQVVIHGHGKVLTVERQGTGWTYTDCADGQADCAPAAAADQGRSLQLVQSLTELRPSHVIYGAPEGLPAYGVEKPTSGEIDIKGVGGQQVTILLGGKSNDGASYFMRRQDSQDVLVVAAATIDAQFLALLDKPPTPQAGPAPSAAPSAAAPDASPTP